MSIDGSASSSISTSTGAAVGRQAAAAGLGQRGLELAPGEDAAAGPASRTAPSMGAASCEVVGDGQRRRSDTGYSRTVPGAERSSVGDVVAEHRRVDSSAFRGLAPSPDRAPRAVLGGSRWRRVALVEHARCPRRMLWSALTHSPSSRTSTVAAYWLRAPLDLRRVRAVPGHDQLRRPQLRGPGELPLLDQERGLLLRTREDALGLLLGALDQAAWSPR